MARNAVGVLGGGGDARQKQRQYAEELEEQLRMKKVIVVTRFNTDTGDVSSTSIVWCYGCACVTGGGAESKSRVA
jgi:hypothetical protein